MFKPKTNFQEHLHMTGIFLCVVAVSANALPSVSHLFLAPSLCWCRPNTVVPIARYMLSMEDLGWRKNDIIDNFILVTKGSLVAKWGTQYLLHEMLDMKVLIASLSEEAFNQSLHFNVLSHFTDWYVCLCCDKSSTQKAQPNNSQLN